MEEPVATKLKLMMLASDSEAARPILDGTIEIEGVELQAVDPLAEAEVRRHAGETFDLVETSLVAYLVAREGGSSDWLIPVFPSRRFSHTDLSASQSAGIAGPQDLGDKRVGVSGDSAAMWTRAVLAHDFGVANPDVRALPQGRDPLTALTEHEVDVASVADRVVGLQRLFPSSIEEGSRYFKEHGFIPAETAYVLRADLYAESPWLAFNIYKAFLLAKDVAKARLARSIPSGLIFGADYLRRTRQMFGDDPSPDGLRRNRAMLDAAVTYAQSQGLTQSHPKIEDLIPPQLTEF